MSEKRRVMAAMEERFRMADGEILQVAERLLQSETTTEMREEQARWLAWVQWAIRADIEPRGFARGRVAVGIQSGLWPDDERAPAPFAPAQPEGKP